MPNNAFITFEIFNTIPGLVCAFSTRFGGISQAAHHFKSLRSNRVTYHAFVEKNHRFILKQLGIENRSVAMAGQIHSANVRWITEPGYYPDTDALICRQKGIFLTVQTADCFPLMIYIPGSEIVAVVHCGWRGVASGIVQNVLSACDASMHEALAVIGPGIQKTCYEVGSDVFLRFDERYLVIHNDPQKRYLDLSGVIVDILLAKGFSKDHIYCEPTCTHCAADLFYSYRREGVNSGRMLGVMGMR
jgi:YfiH family protein